MTHLKVITAQLYFS